MNDKTKRAIDRIPNAFPDELTPDEQQALRDAFGDVPGWDVFLEAIEKRKKAAREWAEFELWFQSEDPEWFSPTKKVHMRKAWNASRELYGVRSAQESANQVSRQRQNAVADTSSHAHSIEQGNQRTVIAGETENAHARPGITWNSILREIEEDRAAQSEIAGFDAPLSPLLHPRLHATVAQIEQQALTVASDEIAKARCDHAVRSGYVTHAHTLCEDVAAAIHAATTSAMRAELIRVAADAVNMILQIDKAAANVPAED